MATIEVGKGWIRKLTMQDAVRRAGPGDTIVIPPGRYTGSDITITQHDVHLRPSAPGEVELAFGICITGSAVLDHLVLRTRDTAVQVVQGGRAVVQGCTLHTADSAFMVHGVKSHLEVRHSTVSQCGVHVLHVRDKATALIEHCSFASTNDEFPLLIASHAGHLQLNQCRFDGLQSNALMVREGGHAEMEHCVLRGVTSTAIIVGEAGSKLEVSDCTLQGATGNIVSVSDQGQVLMTDCDVHDAGTTFPLVIASRGAQVQLLRTRLHDSASSGVSVYEQAQAQLTECEFATLGSDAVDVADLGSRVCMTRCRVHDIASHAIYARSHAQVELLDCEVQGAPADKAGISVGDHARATLRGGKVHHMPWRGIVAAQAGHVEIFHTELAQIADAALWAKGADSHLTAQQVRLVGTGRQVLATEQGTVQLVACHFADVLHEAEAWASEEGGVVALSGCTLGPNALPASVQAPMPVGDGA